MTAVLSPTDVPTRGRVGLRRAVADSVRSHDLLWPHALAFVVVNTMLVTSWVLVAARGVFWPLVPIVGWGTRLTAHAVATFRDRGDGRFERTSS